MGLFSNKNGGMMDVIRCDEPSYLIWKWHPTGSTARNNKRENAIRWGSSLRVNEGEVAVFVYDQTDGTQMDFIEGPHNGFIETVNFPVLASIIGVAFAGASPFQAEIYFINLARIIQSPFAVPFFDVFDPRFLDFAVPVAVRGTINFNITDYREFIKLQRLRDFNLTAFQTQIRDAVVKHVKDVVANMPAEKNIPVVQIERQIALINETVEEAIKQRLFNNFGVTVTGVDISVIELDKNSDGFMSLKNVTQDVSTATVEAQTAADVRNIHDMQRINAENVQETLRIQREEGQYAQRKQTQTENFAAYQTEAQAEVGVAGANALGQMGAGGAGDVSGGGGFNPAAMMTGMAIGGAMGQNIAGTMNNMMSSMNQPQAGMTPPPIPTVAYNVVVNNSASGPFDMTTLAQMVLAGTLTMETLVWKAGMGSWVKAGTIQELQEIFISTPPVPPPMPPIPPIPPVE